MRIAQLLANAKELVFPGVPSTPTPLPLPAYVATFNHPAYHNLTVSFCNSTSPTAATPCDLRVSPIETFGQQVHLELEHVSGAWWLARLFYDDHDPTLAAGLLKVQAEIVGGVVTKIGVDVDQDLLIWFERVL